ncbi:MAG: hypothetical protein U0R26_08595 [Solirubrobacterales bacterium]
MRDTLSRAAVGQVLGVRAGRIEVIEDGGGHRRFGPAEPDLRATVRILPGGLARPLRGGVGIGETYVRRPLGDRRPRR